MINKYIYSIIFFPLLILSLLTGCSKKYYEIPLEVVEALNLAGENSTELFKVLDHYNNKKDSLKYYSACYLIENMPSHQAIYHKNTNRINFVLKEVGRYIDADKKRAIWDSLAPYLAAVSNNELEFRKDIETIEYDFLVDNIDNAFFVWENYPWCKNLSFEDFKRYILPYRSSDEPLTKYRMDFMSEFSWLIDSMGESDDRVKAFAFIYNDFESWFKHTTGVKYPIPMNFEQLMIAKGGTCSDECNLLSAIMRSLGIVSVIDNINYWANRSSGHSWVAALDNRKTPLIMDKYTNYPERRRYLHSGYWPLDPPEDSLLSEKLYVTIEKKAAKIVRKTFSPNSEALKFSNQQMQIPNEFKNPFNIDVTNQYLDAVDVIVESQSINIGNYYYLCLFEKDMFLPVDISDGESGRCRFYNVGSEIAYICTEYIDGKFLPVSDPFIVNTDGSKKYLKPDSNIEEMTVYRKYPLFGNVLNYANSMYGGSFQGSNNSDFLNAVDLYNINYSPIKIREFKVDRSQRFQYYRYLPPQNNNGDIAELTFLNGSQILQGNIIYKHKGIGARSIEKAFDNNYNTYYQSDSAGTWIGMDLGQSGSQVTKIRFCPRSDTNFILSGNVYELYYWDKGWCLFETKRANSQFLVFNNVPKGTLYWLKCLNGGNEERPFTYNNGIQQWL